MFRLEHLCHRVRIDLQGLSTSNENLFFSIIGSSPLQRELHLLSSYVS